jgi:hypothetical protein
MHFQSDNRFICIIVNCHASGKNNERLLVVCIVADERSGDNYDLTFVVRPHPRSLSQGEGDPAKVFHSVFAITNRLYCISAQYSIVELKDMQLGNLQQHRPSHLEKGRG